MTAQIYRHPGIDRLVADDIRRRDAMDAFIRAEKARKTLIKTVRFLAALSLVGWATLAFVVIAYTQR